MQTDVYIRARSYLSRNPSTVLGTRSSDSVHVLFNTLGAASCKRDERGRHTASTITIGIYKINITLKTAQYKNILNKRPLRRIFLHKPCQYNKVHTLIAMAMLPYFLKDECWADRPN